MFVDILFIGLARQSNALLKEEGCEIDIDFYIMSVLALLKLIQVSQQLSVALSNSYQATAVCRAALYP